MLAIFGVIIMVAGFVVMLDKESKEEDVPLFTKLWVIFMGALLVLAQFIQSI